METANKLSRTLNKLGILPQPLRSRAISAFMGRMVPFVGTAGIRIEEMTHSRVVASISNRRHVRNHIGSVHAAAMVLLAETATGFVVGMNVPDTRLPLMKSMKVDFKRRLKGALRVEAVLTEEQRSMIAAEEKGEVSVQVVATDESGQEPIQCEMIWAWVPRRQ